MKLIFHIGAGKTGSSAIQHSLVINNQNLNNNGIFVPTDNLSDDGKRTGYHVWYFESIKKMDSSAAIDELKNGIERSVADAKENNCHTVVFSAENLSNPFQWSEYLSDIVEPYETAIVMYIRRQDEFLLSAWQQWGLKSGKTFELWLTENIGVMGDWSNTLREWSRFVGTENMIVRVYERDALVDRDVVSDFFSLIGSDAGNIARSKSTVNPSYSIAAEELALSASAVFENSHDNEFFRFLDQHACINHKKNGGESRISVAQRNSILSRYSASNNWIKSTFFEGQEAPLFSPPHETDYQLLSGSELEEKKWALVMELIYGMYKHGKKS